MHIGYEISTFKLQFNGGYAEGLGTLFFVPDHEAPKFSRESPPAPQADPTYRGNNGGVLEAGA
jgi:hypothetical protein